MILPPLRLLHWKRAWRVIPTLYPEEEIYAPIAARGDWAAIVQLERWTNSGVRQELGDRRFLREGDHLPRGKSAYHIGRPFAFPPDLTDGRVFKGSTGSEGDSPLELRSDLPRRLSAPIFPPERLRRTPRIGSSG